MSLAWINQINTPQEWAVAQLAYMHLPDTQSNINFLVSWAAKEGGNWNNTASFNPLNTTYRLAGSTVMGGGNTAGVQAYQNWAQGLQATADTLGSYGEILAALRAGDAMTAGENGSLAGNLSTWSGGGYTTVGTNVGYGGTTGGAHNPAGTAVPGAVTQNTATGGTGGGTGLTMHDLPAVKAYIQANYPEDAWLLSNPSVAPILEKAAIQGLSAQNVVAEVQATSWFKTTSASMRQYESTLATDPAALNFSIAGSQANQTLSDLQNMAAKNGLAIQDVPITLWRSFALDSIKYGWDAAQQQAAIGYYFVGAHVNDQNFAPGVTQQLQAAAGQYLQNIPDNVLQSWAANIVGGTQTIDQFNAYLKQNASTKWTGMAPMIQQGYTPEQIVAPLQQSIASTLELSPDQINFVTDPKFAKILDYVPPNSTTGVHQLMTESQAQQYVKSDPSFGFQNTQNARDSAAQLEQTLVQNFGKVAG